MGTGNVRLAVWLGALRHPDWQGPARCMLAHAQGKASERGRGHAKRRTGRRGRQRPLHPPADARAGREDECAAARVREPEGTACRAGTAAAAPTWLTSLSRRLAPTQAGSTSMSCLHLAGRAGWRGGRVSRAARARGCKPLSTGKSTRRRCPPVGFPRAAAPPSSSSPPRNAARPAHPAHTPVLELALHQAAQPPGRRPLQGCTGP